MRLTHLNNVLNLEYFEDAVNSFSKATDNYQETLKQLNTKK